MAPPEYSTDFVERMIWRRGRLHPIETLHPARTALIVVDMQRVFMDEGALLECPAARAIVPTINRLSAAVRATGGSVIFLAMTLGPDEADGWDNLLTRQMAPERGQIMRESVTPGARGHELWPDIKVADGDRIVHKNRFGGFSGTKGRLATMLRDAGCDTVLITGTITNVCCETTAREAAAEDFKTIMISDANGGRSPEQDLATYSVFLDVFGDVRTAGEIIAMLEEGARKAQAGSRRIA